MLCQVVRLSNSEAHLAPGKSNPFTLRTEPHDHSDGHFPLCSLGLLKMWVQAGVKWVAFFQDTNALVFRGLPAALGEGLPPDIDTGLWVSHSPMLALVSCTRIYTKICPALESCALLVHCKVSLLCLVQV